MYTPTAVPSDPGALSNYLSQELQYLAQSLAGVVPFVVFQTLNSAPTKPRDGMVVKADGVHWNPGSGAGFYGYKAGAWAFLG